MPRSPLYEKFAAAGARMGEYDGAETALAFSAPAEEIAELRSGAALYDLGWRSKIVITGNDRVRWLNGMVTNNIKDLPASRGNYDFLLNAQGRILADMYIYNRGDYFVVDTAAWQAPNILALFDQFIIMDEVEASDASSKLTAIAMQGAKAAEVMARAGIDTADMDEMEIRDFTWNGLGLSVARIADHVSPGYEIWLAPANAAQMWDALLQAGAKPVGMDAVDLLRVAAGIPRYGQDIRERDLPQETGQKQALNFHKGCYIGQEIVERIHSRGNVHRQLTGLLLEGNSVSPGAKVLADGKEVGEVTSVRCVPTNAGERTVALGYVRRETAAPGTELLVGETPARVAKLPFAEVFGS